MQGTIALRQLTQVLKDGGSRSQFGFDNCFLVPCADLLIIGRPREAFLMSCMHGSVHATYLTVSPGATVTSTNWLQFPQSFRAPYGRPKFADQRVEFVFARRHACRRSRGPDYFSRRARENFIDGHQIAALSFANVACSLLHRRARTLDRTLAPRAQCAKLPNHTCPRYPDHREASIGKGRPHGLPIFCLSAASETARAPSRRGRSRGLPRRRRCRAGRRGRRPRACRCAGRPRAAAASRACRRAAR